MFIPALIKVAYAQGTISLADKVIGLYKASMGIAAIAALAVIIYAGIAYSSSAGNPEKISSAKKWAYSAVLGLIILFGSFLIFSFINPQLLTPKEVLFLTEKTKEPEPPIPEPVPVPEPSPVPSPGPPPETCVTSGWSNAGCGGDGCAATQMYQTQTVNPAGCAATEKCVSDPVCDAASCDSCPSCGWNNIGCGAWGCPSNQMAQGRPKYWSDGHDGQCGSDGRCVSDSSCAPTDNCAATGRTAGGSCSNNYTKCTADTSCTEKGYVCLFCQYTDYGHWNADCSHCDITYTKTGSCYCSG
jgi:hypothetical protein